MSSAILYLAIVAIWAGVLVPRWLRLRSAPVRQVSAELDEGLATDPDLAAPDLGDPQIAGSARIVWEESYGPQFELADSPRPDDHPQPVSQPRTDDEAPTAEARQTDPVPAAAVAGLTPAERRARILRARRRMLATVVLLTAVSAGIALMHLAPSWVVIPPVLMLAGFFVLLHEAAHTDALRARQPTVAAHADSPAVAGEERLDPSQRQAPATAAAATAAPAAPARAAVRRAMLPDSAEELQEASAQVIDISGRIGDQLYDQYTDAAERAVGD